MELFFFYFRSLIFHNRVELTKEKLIIGRIEIAHFPLLHIDHIEVKIDTGAYTSSIHCESIEKVDDKTVRCIFLYKNDEEFTGEPIDFEIVKETVVKSSNGLSEKRFMIKTKIGILGREYEIFLTLTDRGDMKYPVLIGRKFLAKKFIVDVTRKNQSLN